jgi:hypothetical protein
VLDDGSKVKHGDVKFPSGPLHRRKVKGYKGTKNPRPIYEASKEYSDAERAKLAGKGKAMPHGGFPIENTADLKRAIQAVGRAKNPAAAKAWIIKRAKALGASDMLPDGWNVQESERGEMAIDYDMLVEAVIAIATAEALPTSKEIAEAADAIERMTGDQRGKLYGDDALSEAADSMAKASTPEPWSKSKTSNWVARAGGLPDYIQHISHDLHEKRGMPESRAIAMAIGIVKRWCRGGGKVDATTRAAACKPAAEWEAKKAKAHAS